MEAYTSEVMLPVRLHKGHAVHWQRSNSTYAIFTDFLDAFRTIMIITTKKLCFIIFFGDILQTGSTPDQNICQPTTKPLKRVPLVTSAACYECRLSVTSAALLREKIISELLYKQVTVNFHSEGLKDGDVTLLHCAWH